VGPVFLFYMGVVVFMIGSTSSELDGLFSLGKVPLEVIVEELASIIAIEAEDGKREGFFDMFDLFQDPCFTFAPYGSLFGPSGGDIDEIDGIDVHTSHGIAAVGDGIGFKKTGS